MLRIFSCVYWLSALEKCLFKTFAHFLIGYFKNWVYESFICFGYKFLIWRANTFSSGLTFHFFTVFSEVQKFLILMKAKLPMFFFCLLCWVSYLRNNSLIQSDKNLYLCFLFKSFIVFTLTFRSVIHFALVFVRCKEGTPTLFSYPGLLIEKTILFPLNHLGTLMNINWS